MNRYARKPKKRRDEEDDEEQGQQDLVGVSVVPAIASQHLVNIKPLGRPYKTDEEKHEVFLQLIRLKENRKTNKECAETLGVSERSITNYLADPYYGELVQNIQQDAKERGHLLISDVIDDAIQKLYGLMQTAKSEFVQYKSAEYILKVAGYEIPREQMERDNQADVIAFLSKLDERQKPRVQVNVQINQQTPDANIAINASESENRASMVESVPTNAFLPEKASSVSLNPELARYMRPMLPGGKLPSDDEDSGNV
jgi:hypothetical protein